MPICSLACGQPLNDGICKMSISSWYFDTKSGECQFFLFGGCGGNDNRFDTYEACSWKCLGYVPRQNEYEDEEEDVEDKKESE